MIISPISGENLEPINTVRLTLHKNSRKNTWYRQIVRVSLDKDRNSLILSRAPAIQGPRERVACQLISGEGWYVLRADWL